MAWRTLLVISAVNLTLKCCSYAVQIEILLRFEHNFELSKKFLLEDLFSF